jgi:hypothetical protein
MSTIEVIQPPSHKRVSVSRRVMAAVLDFFCAFYIAGYVVGFFTGDLADGGFELKGVPALIVFALIAAYFVVFTRFLGGTVWQRLLGARTEHALG